MNHVAYWITFSFLIAFVFLGATVVSVVVFNQCIYHQYSFEFSPNCLNPLSICAKVFSIL